MAAPREKSVFKVGCSMLSDRVYAGLVRGSMFVGKKNDVTDSFLDAMVSYITRGKRMGMKVVTVDGLTFEVTCRQRKIRLAKETA